jgi:predicted NBD/HSP70 family sugar kinase
LTREDEVLVVQSAGLSRSEASVISALHAAGSATRADLANLVGLGPAMIAKVVAHLRDLNLIREAGRGAVTGPGRQASLLEVNPSAGHVLGIDIGTDVVHLLVSDLHGSPIVYEEIASSRFEGRTQPEIIGLLADLADQLLDTTNVGRSGIRAIGLAITGIVDSDQGVCVMRSNTPGWEQFPIASVLGAVLRIPVVLEESARAKSLAERRLGAADAAACPAGSFLYVDAGPAVGAGLVVNGVPFRGVGGLAGELGHVTVDPGGALCRCGNRGCLQATASARAVLAHAADLLQQGVYSSLAGRERSLTLVALAAAAAEGDKLALGVLTEAGEHLGTAIAMALNLLGLDLVVMGGTLVRCGPVVIEAAQRVVRLRVLPVMAQPRVLVRGRLGSDAAALGVVLQALDWLFAAPNERIVQRTAAFNDARTDRSVVPTFSSPVGSFTAP